MYIRIATPDDATALAAVAAETFPLACPPSTTRSSIDDFIARHLSADRMLEYLADPARVLLLAEDAAEIAAESAGYAMLIFGEPADADVAAAITARPTAELSKLYVREGFHGQGIAPLLVETALAAALEHGAGGVWLGVNQLNARANRFYEKSGFTIVGTKRFLVGDTYEDDFVRELRFPLVELAHPSRQP